MKTSARKPANKSRSATVTRSGSFFKASGSSGFFASAMRKASTSPAVQTAGLSVSKPGDPLERAADRTADAVLRMPAEQVQRSAPPDRVQRAASDASERVQRAGTGAPTPAADTTAEIQRAATGGQALAPEVRTFMEPRFGADLSGVRVHTDATAQALSNHLSARAFAYRNHIFFGRDQYQPGTDVGRHLIAHELTHTIQQGATVQRAESEAKRAVDPDVERDAAPEVQRAEQQEVQRSTAPEGARSPRVTASGSAPAVQRFGVVAQKGLDYLSDKASYLPGFRMLTLVLGFNPVNQRRADRTPANFLRALIELVPGGVLITRVLDTHGVIDKAANWVEEKVESLGDLGGQLVQAIKDFVNGLEWSDVGDLSGVWERAKRLITAPIDRLIAFGSGVVGQLLDLVRDAILKPLAALAQPTRGYDLLKAILGKDPITGEAYPRTAENLIGGFMKLIGQDEVWQNIQRGKAVARAYAWFQGALAGLMTLVKAIPGRIVQTIRSLTFADVVTVVGAFSKVVGAFADAAVQFVSWAGKQVLSLLEILVSVVAPGVMPYIAKAKAAFATIVKDPVRFVGNLVRAGRLGFQKFADNILEHLKTALIKWLVGPLARAGVYIPKSFSLLEIVKLVLSVLGLTWQNIRTKLVKIIPAPVLEGLEKTATVLVTLATEGPAAAWEQIKTELTELKDQLIGQVTSMIQMEVVKAAVKKLVMMINPAGAVVQAISAIWTTVTFFIEKAQQIGAVVASFIDSIAAIAAGQVENAAKRVEKTMADTLVVVIGFLANFAGLGGIPDKLVGIVKKIRAPIDKGLDKIVAWLDKMLKSLVGKAKDAAKKLLQWWKKKVPIKGGDEPHTLTFQGEGKSARLVAMSTPEKPSLFLKREHKRSGKDEELLTNPYNKTVETEGNILEIQGKLARLDDNDRSAASGSRRTDVGGADDLSKQLDDKLAEMADTIAKALTSWGRDGDLPETIEIERAGGFTVTQKAKIAKEYEAMKKRLAGTEFARTDYLVDDSRGRTIGVETGVVDRRHVVSSDDMAKHYGSALAGKKFSQAKLLLEQRSSIADAREPVTEGKLTKKALIAAAKRRYRRFFGYAKNIFLGDSSENRSIQEHLDRGHPEMAGKKLRDHVARIKREWALDSTFKPTE